jgi:hypothetical protein
MDQLDSHEGDRLSWCYSSDGDVLVYLNWQLIFADRFKAMEFIAAWTAWNEGSEQGEKILTFPNVLKPILGGKK